jgi:DNA-binding CsgD family transcriptional regulator
MRPFDDGSVAGSATTERLKLETLSWLCAAVNTRAGVFYQVDDDLRQSHFLTHNVDLSFHQRYVRELHRLDPLHPSRLQSLPGPVVRLSDTLPASGREHSEYFQMFVAPQRIDEIVEVFFRRDGRVIAGVSLLKYGRASPLSAGELALLARTQPLIESYLSAMIEPQAHTQAHEESVQAQFTERERVVLALVASGLSNKAIARRLAIGVPTVKTHIRSILAKTGTTSRVTLLAKVFWH